MSDTVEAAIVHENGRLCFVAADTKQLGLKTGPDIDPITWCDLKADISPHGHDASDIHFDAIYAVNYTTESEHVLTGQDRKDAEAILIADEKWLEWAREEIRERRRAA